MIYPLNKRIAFYGLVFLLAFAPNLDCEASENSCRTLYGARDSYETILSDYQIAMKENVLRDRLDKMLAVESYTYPGFRLNEPEPMVIRLKEIFAEPGSLSSPFQIEALRQMLEMSVNIDNLNISTFREAVLASTDEQKLRVVTDLYGFFNRKKRDDWDYIAIKNYLRNFINLNRFQFEVYNFYADTNRFVNRDGDMSLNYNVPFNGNYTGAKTINVVTRLILATDSHLRYEAVQASGLLEVGEFIKVRLKDRDVIVSGQRPFDMRFVNKIVSIQTQAQLEAFKESMVGKKYWRASVNDPF